MKNKKVNFISIIISTIFLLIMFTIIFFCIVPQSPDKVFKKSICSIVELKAVSKDIGESYGTAVCIKSNEYLITNAHVITYKQMGESIVFDECFIRLANEEKYHSVEIVKYDMEMDIAVLKIEDKGLNLKPIKIGNSDELFFGDKVYAIGNGSNYGLSITHGIISIPKLTIKYDDIMREVIQSDITISAGNSGGALLNDKGRLVGITSFRTKDNQGNVVYGIVYSIPVNKIIDYLND